MTSAYQVRWMERFVTAAAPFSNMTGRLLDRSLRDIRYSYLTFALLERFNQWLFRRRKGTRPDAFVFECYNPGSADVMVQLHFSIDRTKVPKSVRADQLPPPLAIKLIIPPGYFRRDISYGLLAEIIEADLPFGITVAPDSGEGVHLVFLALDFVVFDQSREAACKATDVPDTTSLPIKIPGVSELQKPPAKCVVFDLDNTLWSGVLLEGQVALKPGVFALLQELDAKGILLSIASKNSYEHAHSKLVEIGIEEYFLFPRINWGRKSDSLKGIAKDIDIGLDTFVFVDDNPFDRDEVATTLPQVEVLAETSLKRLSAHPRLTGSTSAEARARRHMYRQAMVRSAAAQEFGADYLAFLRSCQIHLEIRPPLPADFQRISELVQRTNQLNFSGNKYNLEQVGDLLSEPDLKKFVLSCTDRYGSYGIVGFCIAKLTPNTVRVIDFMLSCRVQGKFIEQALFRYLVDIEPSITRLEVNFRKTDRNTPAQAVLRKLGFDTEHAEVLVREIAPGDLAVDFMTVVSHSHV